MKKLLILMSLLFVSLLSFSASNPGSYSTSYSNRGYYVSRVDTLVLNATYRDSLVRGSRGAKLYLYGATAAMDNSQKKAALATLITAYHTAYPTGQVAVVISTGSTVTVGVNDITSLINKVYAYQQLQEGGPGKFDLFNVEKEYWNKACTFTEYCSQLRAVKNKFGSVEVYLGWFTQTESDSIVKYCNRILLHYYYSVDKISGNYCMANDKKRLNYLAASANKQNKSITIVPIFANTNEFGTAALTANNGEVLNFVFRGWQIAYSTASITYKNRLQIGGMQVYKKRW